MKVRVTGDSGEIIFESQGNTTFLCPDAEAEVIDALKAALDKAQGESTCFAEQPDPQMGEELREVMKGD